ncbi:UNVERIFIED_CONTAM: hypothetical protein K2H54_016520 [Gekko kuhli]
MSSDEQLSISSLAVRTTDILPAVHEEMPSRWSLQEGLRRMFRTSARPIPHMRKWRKDHKVQGNLLHPELQFILWAVCSVSILLSYRCLNLFHLTLSRHRFPSEPGLNWTADLKYSHLCQRSILEGITCASHRLMKAPVRPLQAAFEKQLVDFTGDRHSMTSRTSPPVLPHDIPSPANDKWAQGAGPVESLTSSDEQLSISSLTVQTTDIVDTAFFLVSSTARERERSDHSLWLTSKLATEHSSFSFIRALHSLSSKELQQMAEDVMVILNGHDEHQTVTAMATLAEVSFLVKGVTATAEPEQLAPAEDPSIAGYELPMPETIAPDRTEVPEATPATAEAESRLAGTPRFTPTGCLVRGNSADRTWQPVARDAHAR